MAVSIGDPIGLDVAKFLGQGDDPALVALANQHVDFVAAFARAYTRDRGFYPTAPDVAAVIVTATARLVTNPDQTRRLQIGDYGVSPAVLDGFTLPELFVLNRYRRRAA